MTISLSTLHPAAGSRRRRLRVGRGLARKGTTAGRGTKGQRARTGGSNGLALFGLRQTLRRVPKLRGFKSQQEKLVAVRVGRLEALKGELATPKTLAAAGIIDGEKSAIKLIAGGSLTHALHVSGVVASAGAKAQIEAAGGSIA